MPRRGNAPSYDELIRRKPQFVRPRHPVTQAIMALKPGEAVEVQFRDGDLAAERSRLVSRTRTAKIETGHDYTTATISGRLYVVCLK